MSSPAILIVVTQQGLFAISYGGRSETDVGYLSKFSEECPLFSTNVHGTIKFDKDGVYSNFSDIIEIDKSEEELDNQYYIVNFKQKDKKILDILEELIELQQMADHFQVHSVDEGAESFVRSKKRDLGAEGISLESLMDKIRKLENAEHSYYAFLKADFILQDLGELETRRFEDRLRRLKELFLEDEIGKNIVRINNVYYYKVIRQENKKDNRKKRVE